MKMTIAKTAGFCMGVRRAVDMVLDAANKTSDPIYTYGPLIHNPQVLNMLEQRGIPVMRQIPQSGNGTVLIRAHGVPPQEQKALQDAGFNVINATCPRVIRVQTIIRKHAKKGFSVIIIGDKDHPEVKGLMGYAEEKGYTVSNIEEVALLPKFDLAIVVAQTTQDTALYKSVKEWVSKNCPHYKIFDTICDSTEKRQTEVRKIAGENDAVVVVGGKDSGNTRRLAQIASEAVSKQQQATASSPQKTDYNRRRSLVKGQKTISIKEDNTHIPFAIHIEDVSELDIDSLSSAQSIAITAGASTPNWIIKQTCQTIEDSLEKKRGSLTTYFLKISNFMLRSNFLLAAGAGSLTYSCSELQRIEHNLIHAFVAMFYVLSMQIMNNLFSIKSDIYNNPKRANFYEQNRPILTITAVVSGAIGLYISFTTGILPFIILSCMSLLGLLYNQKIFPDFFPKIYFFGRRVVRIKDIPGSKTVLIAAAWGTVTSLLPAISTSTQSNAITAQTGIFFIIPFLFATSLVFARTAFFAVLEIQGDRITGKETIPIILGEKKSQRVIQNMLLFASAILFITALSGLIATSGILIAAIPLLMLYIIKLHEKGKIHSDMHLEFLIESHFILTGIIVIFF